MTQIDAGRADASNRRALVGFLESLSRAGVTHVTRPPAPASRPATAAASQIRKPAGGAQLSSDPSAPKKKPDRGAETSLDSLPQSTPPAERHAALEIIRHEVAQCTRCDELVRNRTQTVFGVGDPHARLCFLGEAPGADEDRLGEPFVGRAGQLLTKIIEACTLSRDEVYILNTLKCRPPGNRNPLPAEIDHCRGFLNRQLQVIRPEFICCLGSIAAKALLSTETTIGRLRGRFHDYQGIRVLCTYHPAYLLRNPSAKKQVWEDMQMLMAEMGIALPERQ